MGPGDSAVYKSDFTSIEIEEEEDEVPDVFDSSEEPELDRTYIELNRNSKEVTSKNKRYFNYRNLLLDDDFDKCSYRVVDVVKENKDPGPGSKTLYFKYYDTVKYPGGPIKPVDFEYTPCSEVQSSKTHST